MLFIAFLSCAFAIQRLRRHAAAMASGSWHYALQLLRLALQPDLVSYNAVASAVARVSKSRRVIFTYEI